MNDVKKTVAALDIFLAEWSGLSEEAKLRTIERFCKALDRASSSVQETIVGFTKLALDFKRLTPSLEQMNAQLNAAVKQAAYTKPFVIPSRVLEPAPKMVRNKEGRFIFRKRRV
jgi:hypothetical protein